MREEPASAAYVEGLLTGHRGGDFCIRWRPGRKQAHHSCAGLLFQGLSWVGPPDLDSQIAGNHFVFTFKGPPGGLTCSFPESLPQGSCEPLLTHCTFHGPSLVGCELLAECDVDISRVTQSS